MSQLYRIFSQEVGQFCADSSKPDCSKNLLITGLKNLANVDDDKLDEMDPYQRNAKDIIWRAMVGNNRQTASRLGQQSFHAGDDDPLAVGDNELPQESSKTNDYAHPNDNGSGPYLVGPMVIRVYPDGRPVPNDSKRPLPRDEDIDDILPKNKQLPSIVELESSASSKSENRQVPQQQQLSPHPVLSRQMLPPRFSFRRLGTGNRYYSPRLTQLRPIYPNNLLVRDRYY
ncbi:hypothetical protein QAD02_015475 [Eretmocerus hayati]|uniref:Uncharacterized protein n=1 Tax=Eretmocerus hayati TaxID=131215 RepID=A0ACC2P8C3_9HYME|nr:hypothetical protein QAD02_015475 [Eretmocerus hayati]